MSAQNIQVNNVGNLGDIIKHVALVQLGSHVVDYARETQSQIFYIDTHTFIVESLIAKAQQWYDNINSMSSTNPESYEKYKSLQKKRLDSGKPYRCSSGIAIDLFAKEKAKFIFSEQDSKTREILKNQLSQEPLSSTDYTIMTHSTQLSSLKDLDLLKCNQSVLFALVDPFELTQEEWQAIMNGIESIQETANVKEGVIEAFNYCKSGGENVKWEEYKPPKGFQLTAKIVSGRYTLAIYCTNGLSKRVKEELMKLNWHII